MTASKTEFLGADSSVQRSEDEPSKVEFDRNSITVTHGEHDEKENGKINSYTCNWPQPFKQGKTVMKVTFTGGNGETMDATITIEGKGNKIGFLVELDNQPDKKIRLTIDSFEEKK